MLWGTCVLAIDAPADAADAGTDENDQVAYAAENNKPKANSKPKFASSVSQRGIKGSGVVKGQFTLKNPKRDMLIGSFKGVREDRAFIIPPERQGLDQRHRHAQGLDQQAARHDQNQRPLTWKLGDFEHSEGACTQVVGVTELSAKQLE